ncbi:putative RNA-directed DNA polymerase [Tanacetum coccineum]
MTLDLDCLTIILGDFNVVRNATERSDSIFCQRSATTFNSFISSTGLADIPLGGTRFTRMNRQGSKLSKLDRFLVSSNFLANWPNAHVSTLTRDYSDHAPILLHVEATDFGPPPFRFYNSWLSKKDFEPILIDSWALRFVRPTSYFVIFKSKLQFLKKRLKQWRLNSLAKEKTTLKSLHDTIQAIDLKAESSPLSTLDINLRSKTVKDLSEYDLMTHKDLRQKAKSKWALEGDENSRFFHGVLNSNRNRSRINGLNVQGIWTTNPTSIKEHVFRSFQAKFREDSFVRPSFTSNLFSFLSQDESSLLEQPFSLQEIKDAVWSCGGEKAPGPDGFTFKLIKKHWSLFSEDIFSYVKEFESSGFIPRGCNSSFITLVPKIDDPLSLNDYRPISLIGCQYKIIAKLLANRLSTVISSVVSDVQMAFIKGRQIIDGPLIVDEIIS